MIDGRAGPKQKYRNRTEAKKEQSAIAQRWHMHMITRTPIRKNSDNTGAVISSGMPAYLLSILSRSSWREKPRINKVLVTT
jgi:hypothetical protein